MTTSSKAKGQDKHCMHSCGGGFLESYGAIATDNTQFLERDHIPDQNYGRD